MRKSTKIRIGYCIGIGLALLVGAVAISQVAAQITLGWPDFIAQLGCSWRGDCP